MRRSDRLPELRHDGDDSATLSLPHVIVGRPVEAHTDTRSQERAQALSGGSRETHSDRSLGKSFRMSSNDLSGEPCSNRAIAIRHRVGDLHLLLTRLGRGNPVCGQCIADCRPLHLDEPGMGTPRPDIHKES